MCHRKSAKLWKSAESDKFDEYTRTDWSVNIYAFILFVRSFLFLVCVVCVFINPEQNKRIVADLLFLFKTINNIIC